MLKNNIVLDTDCYKAFGHAFFYPEGTTEVVSYLESRGGQFQETVFFGLQYIMKAYLEGPVLEKWMIEEANQAALNSVGTRKYFNEVGWNRLLEKHNGYLPIEIRAVPEGTPLSVNNVMVTVRNTDPEFPWLTSYMETLLLRVWYPITVATTSFQIRNKIAYYAKQTTDRAYLPVMLNDFGARGVSSKESAAVGGMAHLTVFNGSDNLEGARTLAYYYNSPWTLKTIPATEHSIMTAKGRDGEASQIERVLNTVENGYVAIVMDSYDIFKGVSEYIGEQFKDKIISRNGTLVIRPDSGEPDEVLPKLLNILESKFGVTVNEKGFKVLPNCVRLIWGDGINYHSIIRILALMVNHGWSVENIVFGMGGALLQKCDRDTQKFAFKACAMQINGTWCDIFKDPVTDTGKRSKKGHLVLLKNNAGNPTHVTVNRKPGEKMFGDILETVFLNGQIVKEYTLPDVRKNMGIE